MGLLKNFLKLLYDKLVLINDTPQKIALGFGLGVFLGILPLTGPVAALVLSVLLRVNRVAALAGSLLTNTWLSVVSFFLAIKIGAAVIGLKWEEVKESYELLLKDFHWRDLLGASVLKIIEPLVIGYAAIGFISAFLAYLIALMILNHHQHKRHARPESGA